MGASNVVSYLAGSIGPVVGGLAIWAKARKFSGASASIFAFTAVSAIIALIASTSPKVLLYKDCATTALIGLIFLGSCVLARKPLVFYFAQRYGTDGTHDGMAIFDIMWDTYRDFRAGMYVTSYLWAALFLIQAGGTALIIRPDAATPPPTTTTRSCPWSRPRWASSDRSRSAGTSPTKAKTEGRRGRTHRPRVTLPRRAQCHLYRVLPRQRYRIPPRGIASRMQVNHPARVRYCRSASRVAARSRTQNNSKRASAMTAPTTIATITAC